MKEQPKTVVCTSCSAKFHVPDELIRGKLVKFRCRKCGSAMEVDGRKSARPPPAPELPPPPPEPPGVDTPATFSQRTLPPPPRPPTTFSGAPNLHAWPEPPRTRSTTAPTSLYESSPPELSLPRLESVRDPSNRGPKIAAMVALLVAAGLSGVGLAMRGSPPGAASPGEASDLEGLSRPYIPPGASEPARSRAETWGDNANRSNRNPTRVTDLPRAAPPEQPTAAGVAAAAKPSEAVTEKHEPAALREAVDGAPVVAIANSEGHAPAAAGEPSALDHADPTTQENGPALPVAGNDLAVPNAANSGSPVTPPAPAARAKGDFNTQAAREALEDAAGRAAKCKTIDTPSGNARVAVTFAPNGQVTNAVIDSGPIVGTAAGTCVASKFRAARVPPFSGDAVLVRKNVRF
jgi:predicted RNA-binding Zn-ribbon protein involved in translation (DUF1610 family)